MSDFDDPRLDVIGMLIEAEASVSQVLADALASETDLSRPFLGVLIRLGRSPRHELRMTQLAIEMSITTSGLTRLIDRMETAGLVERRTCPSDRRGLLARLTPAGEEKLATVLPRHLEHIEERVLRHLADDESATLVRLLRKLRNGVRGAAS